MTEKDDSAGLIHQVASPLAGTEPRPTIHELKTWPKYYEAVVSGAKTFEARKNDRNFKEGDLLRLREWDPCTQTYSGRCSTYRAAYVLTDEQHDAVREGFAIIALGICEQPTEENADRRTPRTVSERMMSN